MSEDDRKKLDLTIEDWLAVRHMMTGPERIELDPATKEAWRIIQESPALGAAVVRQVRAAYGHNLDVMKEGQGWIVRVRYDRHPTTPYAEPDGPMPDERKGRLISAGVHADGTGLTAEVVAENKVLAERIALGVVRWWAHIYGLGEPSRVHVMDN
ncbi:hypothetical protein G3I24_48440 [Micromonospora aurantiaca]|nr:hypothetical protein [Micromonospora aurantiaca]